MSSKVTIVFRTVTQTVVLSIMAVLTIMAGTMLMKTNMAVHSSCFLQLIRSGCVITDLNGSELILLKISN